MARIRTIKPEFFRHEGLQDCEAENPGSYVMLVFAGLWGHCDKAGRFEWRPRQLKLDILPFLNFDMGQTLALLERIGVLFQYEVEGVKYGCIPSLAEHQRFSGKEAQEPEKHPAPPVKQAGSNGELSVTSGTGAPIKTGGDASHPPLDGVSRLFLHSEEKPRKLAKNNVGSTGEAMGKHLPAQEREGNGIREEEEEREGNGDEARDATAPPTKIISPFAQKPSKGSRWPSDAVVPDDWIFAAEDKLGELGLPPIDLRLEATKFANYWASKAGGAATKADWRKTWINWVLNAKGAQNGRASATDGSGGTFADAFGRLASRARAAAE